jgi:hypothetical protein
MIMSETSGEILKSDFEAAASRWRDKGFPASCIEIMRKLANSKEKITRETVTKALAAAAFLQLHKDVEKGSPDYLIGRCPPLTEDGRRQDTEHRFEWTYAQIMHLKNCAKKLQKGEFVESDSASGSIAQLVDALNSKKNLFEAFGDFCSQCYEFLQAQINREEYYIKGVVRKQRFWDKVKDSFTNFFHRKKLLPKDALKNDAFLGGKTLNQVAAEKITALQLPPELGHGNQSSVAIAESQTPPAVAAPPGTFEQHADVPSVKAPTT